jgi:hypothetical protein
LAARLTLSRWSLEGMAFGPTLATVFREPISKCSDPIT